MNGKYAEKVYRAAKKLAAAILVIASAAGSEPIQIDLDSEDTDMVLECEKRWARQNHSAAEGLQVPSDFERNWTAYIDYPETNRW